MAASCTEITAAAIASTSNASTYTSASYTPVANRLYLLAVVHSDAAAEATVPTISTTTGQTFTQVDSSIVFNTIASNAHRITLFRSMASSGLSAGTYTVNFTDASTGCAAMLVEVTGVLTSGTNGADAIRNTSTNNADATANPNVTFGAFSGVQNGAIMFVGADTQTAPTNDSSGWTSFSNPDYNTPATGLYGQWRSDNDTSGTCTLASSDWAVIGVELVSTDIPIAPPTGSLLAAGALVGLSFLGATTGSLAISGQAPTAAVAGPGTSITVPAGAIDIAGQAPALGYVLNLPAGTLTLQGQAPSLGGSLSVQPGTGALALSGQATAVQFDGPDPASLSLAGVAPSLVVSAGTGIQVPVGSLTLAGTTPIRRFGGPDTGAIVLAGVAPTVLNGSNITPPTGALVVGGDAAALGFAYGLPVGALALDGVAPTAVVSGGAVAIAVPAGAVAVDGPAPSLAFGLQATGGGLSITGQAPAIAGGLSATVGDLVFDGPAPSLSVAGQGAIVVPVGALTLAGTNPIKRFGGADTGALTLAGVAPTLSVSSTAVTIQPPVGALVIDGTYVGILFSGQWGSADLALSGQAPALAFGIGTPVGPLALAGVAPSVVTSGSNTSIEPGTGQLTTTGQAPLLGLVLSVPTGDVTFSGVAPVVGGAFSATPDTAAATLSGQAPSAVVAHYAQAASGAAVFAGIAPTVSVAGGALSVAPDTGVIVFVGAAPSLGLQHIQSPGTGALVLDGQAPTSGGAIGAFPVVGTLALDGQAPNAVVYVLPAPAVGEMSLVGTTPVLSIGTTAQPGTAGLAIAGGAPTLSSIRASAAITGTYATSAAVTGTAVTLVSITGTLEGA